MEGQYGGFPAYFDSRFEGRGQYETSHRLKDPESDDEHEEEERKKKKKKKKRDRGEKQERGREDSESEEPLDSWRGGESWGAGPPPFWEGEPGWPQEKGPAPWGRGPPPFEFRGPRGDFGPGRGGPRGEFGPGMYPPPEFGEPEGFRRGFMGGGPEMGPNGMPLVPPELGPGGFDGPPGPFTPPFGGPGRGRGFGLPPMPGRGVGRGAFRPPFGGEFGPGPPFGGGPDMPPFWGRGGPPDMMEMGGPRMPMGRGFFPPERPPFMDRGGGEDGMQMMGNGRVGGAGIRGPSRGEQNDYSQHFVDTGMRPQNFIRDVDLTDRFEEYPKLKELIQRKDRLITERATAPMYMQMDLLETELSADVFGTKFDVILIDPPWEEYARRAPGVGDTLKTWNWKDIENLKIEALSDTPSFVFLWVGDGEGLDLGRHCLKKWGFRRCEDICWLKTNRENQAPPRYDESTIMQHTKEHCLMGIKGTVRRSTDGHLIHANVDTDIIISEEPPYGSTRKPEELYHIIEHFAQGRRRLELFGEDHNIRAGWVTVGQGLTSSNFNKEAYVRSFADKDGKVWAGGRGIPVPESAPHLVGSTPEIENLRPKSPVRSQPPPTAQNSASQQGAGASKAPAVRPGPGTAPMAAMVS